MELAKKKKKDQWNKIEDLKKDAHNYNHLILDKDGNTYSGAVTTFSTNSAEKIGCPYVEERN